MDENCRVNFQPPLLWTSLCLEELWRDAEELQFWTDASTGECDENGLSLGGGGFGACFMTPDGPQYMGGSWKSIGVDIAGLHVSEVEMLAVSLAVETWGKYLQQRRIVMRCDNSACVESINRQRCKDPGMAVGLRCLFLTMAKHSFLMRSKHIGTKENVLADSASREDWDEFFRFAKEEFGLESNDMERVEPTLDMEDMMRRIRKAKASVARYRAETT